MLDDVLAAYDAAWNESDAAERARLLARSLTDDAELVDPSGRFQGRQAVNERIAGFSDRFPGARVTISPRLASRRAALSPRHTDRRPTANRRRYRACLQAEL